MTALIGSQLIGFATSREGLDEIHARDPLTGEVIGPVFISATAGEVSRAVVEAGRAFDVYRLKGREERAEFLERIADEIEALGDELLERCGAETRYPMIRLRAERQRTTDQLRFLAGVVREGSWVDATIDSADPARTPQPKPGLRRMLSPIGPVAVFGASNFPMAFGVAGGDTASALAVGCPVVVKAHPGHPGTSELIGRAIVRACVGSGMPSGVFSLLHGGIEVGQLLVQEPGLAGVGFTGSQLGGRMLYDAAAKRDRPIPVFAEMSSVNPVFVLPGAVRERGHALAEGYVASLTLGTGQFCTNPGLVVGLAGAALDQFVGEVGALVRDHEAGPLLTDAIARNYREGVERLRKHGDVQEVSSGIGRGAMESGLPVLFETTAGAFLRDESLRYEVFGPAAVVVRCGGFDEMLSVAHDLEGELTATVWSGSGDEGHAEQLLGLLPRKVGRLVWNGFPTGVEVGHAMHHGGPYPATTDGRFTSVGSAAVHRWARPVCYQNVPDSFLPLELRDANPLGIWRTVDGVRSR